MKYQCELRGLDFYAFHGLYEEEKILGGKFIVDVLLEMTTEGKIVAINDALDYQVIFDIVSEEMGKRQDLVETVAQQILGRLIETFGKAEFCRVSICKCNPAGLFNHGDAVISISHEKA